jgi:acetolactate synthase-1/3 small subunit
MTTHTLSVLVENKAGVLARVAALFSRRGFNIESLAVGPTESDDVSRITIVVAVEGLPLEQVTKQLNKLVNVLKIVELSPTSSVERELVLVKVQTDPTDPTSRTAVLQVADLFRGRVIDVSPESVVIEATGPREKVEALVRNLEPFGIRELVQSGVVAVGRGTRSINPATTTAPSPSLRAV